MTRRGAGEGSIRRRVSDGLWEARWRTSDGRRHSLYARTYALARERLRTATLSADKGLGAIDQRTTVGQWLDEWLATSVAGRLRPRTIESYEMTVRLYLKPAIGRVPLAKLQPEHIARMLRNLTARGDLSPTTVRYACVVLRIALGRALKSGRVHRNVATLVDMPTRAKIERHPLSADQVRAFLASVSGDRLEPLYVLAIATGMRQGELLGLRWQDVDLESGTVTVRHTLQRGSRTLGEPKTESAKRTLRLATSAAEALGEHRRRQAEERLAAGASWRRGDYVFSTRLGDPLHANNVRSAFRDQVRRAELPKQRFHDLRHACATLLLEHGEELGVVSKVLGHSTVSTTLDTYGHLTAGMSQRVADRMDALLKRPASGAG